MKTLRDYITETEAWIDEPATGDDFAINLREECLIETYIVDTVEDGVVLQADEQMMSLLEQYGLIGERIGRYGAVGSNAAQGYSIGEQDMSAQDHQEEIENDLVGEHGGGIGPRQHWQDLMKEGALKRAMHNDAEQMSLQQFVEKYGEYQGAEEFWNDINEPVSDQPTDQSHWDFGRMLELAGCGRKMEESVEQIDEDRYDDMLNAMLKADGKSLLKKHSAELKKSKDIESGKALKQHIKKNPGVLKTYSNAVKRDKKLYDEEIEQVEETAPYEPETDAAHNNPLAAKAADLAPVGADSSAGRTATIDEDGVDPVNAAGEDAEELRGNMTAEAEYQGREVKLGKPMAGDVKKSKVYVRGPKGNVVKVNFGDPNMRIKKSNPARRKSFRARHNCDNPGPRWKARYWSCRAW